MTSKENGGLKGMEVLSEGCGKRKAGKSKPYSTGELNKLIDSLIHPLSKKDKRARTVRVH